MQTFSEYLDSLFFVITSNNVYKIRSRLYGICYLENQILSNCDLNDSMSALITSECSGCFIAVIRDDDRNVIRIIQDCCSSLNIYYYRNDDYWCISNSFFDLCDEVKKYYSLSIDEVFFEQLNSSGASVLSLERTFANEIKTFPMFTEIVIDLKERSLLTEKAEENYQKIHHKVNIDSCEGMFLLDQWISRWASVIKSIHEKGYQLKIDLTGGFDSRVSFALALASGIDLNSSKVHIYSHKNFDKDGQLIDDWIIAKSIAANYGFTLSSDYNSGNGIKVDPNDAYSIYRRILSNIHRSIYPYKYTFYNETPVFYLNGINGESIRGWIGNRNDFFNYLRHPYGVFRGKKYIPAKAWEELLSDWELQPFFSNKQSVNDIDQSRYWYLSVRSRSHASPAIYENSCLNFWQITNFADLDIQQLQCPEDFKGTVLNAVILNRIDPRLLKYPVADGRKFTDEEIAYAENICKRHPPALNLMSVISKIYSDTWQPPDGQSTIAESPSLDMLLYDRFKNEKGKQLFIQKFKNYGQKLYAEAEENFFRKDISFPTQYAAVVGTAMEMLIIEEESNRYNKENMRREDFFLVASLLKQHPEIPCFANEVKSHLPLFQTLRIDALFSTQDEEVSENYDIEILAIDDVRAKLSTPEWFQKNGKGYVIESMAGHLKLEFRCPQSCKMKVLFRSKDVRDEFGERILYEIDIDSLTINGQSTFDDSITVTYTETYEYIQDIKQDETICLSVSWQPHEWAVHKIAKLSHND